ncbi:hypothetical protein C806_01957 [Lachnospiraceae bacterium 3-1]|nr:hypothetical protein C806_01957 [Lachnospiraceae bacterium 3-1]
MAKAVKLADIAERLNVSTVTVSKALSNQKGVSEEMRGKIKQLAKEMGYVSPSVQRRMGGEKSYNIGVLIGESFLEKYDSFYWQMYQMVTTKAASRGVFTMLEVVESQEEQGLELPKLVREGKVDGLIIIGRLSKKYLDFLEQEARLPQVYMDFYDETKDCDAVISDSFYGMYRLVNYLFEMGHEKIAFVGTLLASGSITDRYFGYAKALMEHGQEVRKDWVLKDREEGSCHIDVENYLELPKDMPTAFACNCDLTASEVIRKLNAAGYLVPEDISVVGYDNYLYPGICQVEITTFEVDIKEMARRVIHSIVRKIAGENYRKGVFVVEGHPVYKDSVKKL